MPPSMPIPSTPKMLFQIPAFVCAVIGFLFLWVALATPGWQVVYARELLQWVSSGLWITCQTRPNGMYQCTWMFSQSDFDFYSSAEVAHYRTPAFYQWQRTLLHLYLGVQLCVFFALISFCISNAGSRQRCAVIAFTVLMAVATLSCFILIVAFTVLSYMVEYRFYTVSVSGIYEKQRGYSYYLALTGSFFYLFSLILSLVYMCKVLSDTAASGGLQRMAQAKGQSYSTAYTTTSNRDDYRMATSQDEFPPTFSFQPSYRSSHTFGSSMVDDHYAMKPLPATPRRGNTFL